MLLKGKSQITQAWYSGYKQTSSLELDQLFPDVLLYSWSTSLDNKDIACCPADEGPCCSQGFRGPILQDNWETKEPTQEAHLQVGEPQVSPICKDMPWVRVFPQTRTLHCHNSTRGPPGRTSVSREPRQALLGLQKPDPACPRNTLAGEFLKCAGLAF